MFMKAAIVLAIVMGFPGYGFAADDSYEAGQQYENRQSDGEYTTGDESRGFPGPVDDGEFRRNGESDNQGGWRNDGNNGDGEYGNRGQDYRGESRDEEDGGD